MEVVVLEEVIVAVCSGNVDDEDATEDKASDVGEICDILGKRVSDETPAFIELFETRICVSSVLEE